MTVSKKKKPASSKKNGAGVRKKKKSPVKKKNRLFIWFLSVGVLFLSALVLSYLLSNGDLQQKKKISGQKAQKMEQSAPAKKVAPPLPRHVEKGTKKQQAQESQSGPLSPEKESDAPSVSHSSGLVARIGEIDLAVLQTVLELGQDAKILQNTRTESRTYNDATYQYQELFLAAPLDPLSFAQTLRLNLKLVEGTELLPGEIPTEFRILWKGIHTHFIRLASVPLPAKKKTPLMVVILDDLGENMQVAPRLGSLNFPVTISVLPFTTHATDMADFARKKNLELMLHLPCEAIESPKKVDPGPGGLFISMSEAKILEIVRKDIAAVPGVVGVNNHMGSLFTQDEKRMRIVLRELRRQNLFFLDSLTTSKSSVQAAARKEGVTYIRRNVFLDNVQTQGAIMRQLKKAEALAWEKGQSVAIGHPYPSTLAALEKWQHMRDKRIVMTTVSRLLQEKEGIREWSQKKIH